MIDMIKLRMIGLMCLLVFLVGCAATPPKRPNDLCQIFDEKPAWYDAAKAAEKKWGTPIPLSMSILKQESAFRHNAKPSKYYFLGLIPWGRVSSAYGYAQAQDPVWSEFINANGRTYSRSNFADSLMFIGWYSVKTRRLTGVPLTDSYRQYLAYHEGWGGFNRRSYRNKPKLLKIATKVAQQAKVYARQLRGCRHQLEKNHHWFF